KTELIDLHRDVLGEDGSPVFPAFGGNASKGWKHWTSLRDINAVAPVIRRLSGRERNFGQSPHKISLSFPKFESYARHSGARPTKEAESPESSNHRRMFAGFRARLRFASAPRNDKFHGIAGLERHGHTSFHRARNIRFGGRCTNAATPRHLARDAGLLS